MPAEMHPYQSMPDYQFWNRVNGTPLDKFDPVVRTGFTISASDKVVTAGSCFAQHVARHLGRGGLRHFITERAHPLFSDELAAKHKYGMFAARYGNVYTTRQLRQLIERAYGRFTPVDAVWPSKGGRFCDPFRPQIQPEGFHSPDEVRLDRAQHLSKVREAIEGLSVFVFTLGLTEAWRDSRDGAVFPLVPGPGGFGRFDAGTHEFVNFTVDEIVSDLTWSLEFIRSVNPAARFILTVSPVSLAATATDRHVAVATSFSKSSLRVAAEVVSNRLDLCDYFPSFEIITSPLTRGRYFSDDGRDVKEEGVEHVMGVFFKHYAEGARGTAEPETDSVEQQVRSQNAAMEKVVQVLCDEELLASR